MSNRLSIRLALAVALSPLIGCTDRGEEASHDHAGHKNPAAGAGDATAASSCARHNAPRDVCFICDGRLREPGRAWCGEHGRYEDRCWTCNPGARDASRAFCDEHGLYEDECFLCRPALKGKPNAAASSAAAPSALMCAEHGVPEDRCGICRPERAATLAPGQSMQVRLPAPDSASIAGVETAPPSVGPIAEQIECYADLAYNQTKLAQIVAPASGIIHAVEVDLGGAVAEKQTVAKIWSASIAEAVARAVLTHQNLDREQKLRAKNVTAAKDLQQAEAEHRAACQQLRTFGYTEEQVEVYGANPQEAVYLELRAPFGGEIVEQTAVRGAFIEAGKPLFTLADRSTMWAMLTIPESALGLLAIGQTVELDVGALPGRTFVGKLTWIAADVDGRTRMARARAEIPNPDGALRANLFARARIIVRRTEGALLIPASAIQKVDGVSLVFVKLAGDLFDARAVRIGARVDGRLEVLDGVRAGDDVVVAHGFPLKSHLLLSRLGAG
jgi:cobalt-zinc-cadmium efflux system membrane fusion protein